jgi:hypothetical protein
VTKFWSGLYKVVWTYEQIEKSALSEERQKGKTADKFKCKHMENEIFLCNAMLDDLKNVRNSGIDT